jgi:hypothetical protein
VLWWFVETNQLRLYNVLFRNTVYEDPPGINRIYDKLGVCERAKVESK